MRKNDMDEIWRHFMFIDFCAFKREKVIGTLWDKFLSRDYEVREHIPVPHDNLFQSILNFAPLFLDSSPWPRGPWSEDQMSL